MSQRPRLHLVWLLHGNAANKTPHNEGETPMRVPHQPEMSKTTLRLYSLVAACFAYAMVAAPILNQASQIVA
jgi:hypothetical protein